MIYGASSKTIVSLDPYLINLDNRPDRLDSAVFEAEKLGLSLIRVSAVDSNGICDANSLLSPQATACWESHKLAMELLLKSNSSHCLVFEDDFVITNVRRLKKQLSQVDYSEWDFIQIGFLNTGFRDRVVRVLTNLECDLFRCLRALENLKILKFLKINGRLRIKRLSGVPKGFIPDDVRSGAHCYVISRNCAQFAISLNTPAFLTADGFYSALAWDKYFKMLRVRGTWIVQSASPSSIKVTSE